MATYGGKTFNAEQQGGMLPQWEQPPNVTVRHYAGGNKDNVQFGGRGNYQMDVIAYVDPSIALSTTVAEWQGLVSNTPRTLASLWGQTYTNVYLIAVGAARWNGVSNFYEIPLTFMRIGA